MLLAAPIRSVKAVKAGSVHLPAVRDGLPAVSSSCQIAEVKQRLTKSKRSSKKAKLPSEMEELECQLVAPVAGKSQRLQKYLAIPPTSLLHSRKLSLSEYLMIIPPCLFHKYPKTLQR